MDFGYAFGYVVGYVAVVVVFVTALGALVMGSFLLLRALYRRCQQ